MAAKSRRFHFVVVVFFFKIQIKRRLTAPPQLQFHFFQIEFFQIEGGLFVSLDIYVIITWSSFLSLRFTDCIISVTSVRSLRVWNDLDSTSTARVKKKKRILRYVTWMILIRYNIMIIIMILQVASNEPYSENIKGTSGRGWKNRNIRWHIIIHVWQRLRISRRAYLTRKNKYVNGRLVYSSFSLKKKIK